MPALSPTVVILFYIHFCILYLRRKKMEWKVKKVEVKEDDDDDVGSFISS